MAEQDRSCSFQLAALVVMMIKVHVKSQQTFGLCILCLVRADELVLIRTEKLRKELYV
jgi:hypothetical protein